MRKVLLALLLVAAVATPLSATDIVIPYSFTSGTTILAAEMNANFTAIAAGAVSKSGATMTGALILSTDVTVDGVDISDFLSSAGYVTAGTAGTVSLPSFTVTGDTNTGIYFSAADAVAITAGGVQRALINTSGVTVTGTLATTGSLTITGDIQSLVNLTFSGHLLGSANTAAAPPYSFSGDTNTGIYSATADTIQFSTGGTLRAYVDTTTLRAQGLLSVGGAATFDSTVAVTSTLTVGSSFFSTGQVYPGRVDITGAQASWYLGSHATYGLYSNTGLFLTGALYPQGGIVNPASTSSAYDIVTETVSVAATGGVLDNIAIGNAGMLIITAGPASTSIGGFAGGVQGRRLAVCNNAGNPVALTAQGTSTSTAANRIGMDFDDTVFGNRCENFIYDATVSRWKLFGD